MADDKIRERAYQLWQEEGEPHGRDEDHWHRASTEIGGADGGAQPAVAPEDAHPDETQPEGGDAPAHTTDAPTTDAATTDTAADEPATTSTASAEAPLAGKARAAKARTTGAAPADGKRPRKSRA